jgi:hypothetical protein
MSASQKIYRVYCFDQVHNVLSVDELAAASDEEAIARAEAGDYGTRCELWDGRRLVAEINGQRQQA